MDYRNADGSLAQMCGNGARVFARYLVSTGLAAGPRVPILTRSGVVTAKVGPRTVSVTMPAVSVGGPGVVRLSGAEYKGTEAACGNPNLVCMVDDPSILDLTGTPELDPTQFPDSANVEFVATVAPGHVRMRVVERGVGETLSCGSGACAVAGVVLGGRSGTVVVDVPGGRLRVRVARGGCVLSGPAIIVASGTLSM
jgi:diaminopimelate epimerase